MAACRGGANLQTAAAGRGPTSLAKEVAAVRQAAARVRARTRNTQNQALLSQLQEVPHPLALHPC